MRSSLAKLYAPFIAVALVQALLVAVAPSRPPEHAALTGAPGGVPGEESLEGFDESTGEVARGEAEGPADADTAGTGSTGGDTAPSGSSGGSGQGPEGPPGDTSHCTKDGRQHGVTYHAPRCVPKWSGDNGGATYQGVTKDTIKVVYFREKPNPQVNAILRSQGLANSPEELEAFDRAAVKFLNEKLELYGRTISYEFVQGDCPQTPPDVDACKVAAREVVEKKPFAVIWGTPLYPTVFDEWTRAGIVSLGGWHFDETQFTKRRPYRWDVFMDGTRSAELISEYYCKKLAGKKASHTGPVIHRDIGARNQVQRKLGIVVPKTATNLATAETVRSLVSKCDGGRTPPIFSYESDINRAQEQSTATTKGLIDADVTTVVCMCDPIAPKFATQEATNQQYFPEWLVPGLGLLDYDLLGRLYNSEQWQHAFGPGHLGERPPHSQSDASKVWRAAGNEGDACTTCNLPWAYWELLGGMLQAAGPNLHPLNIEKALVGSGYRRGGWEETGHNPTLTMTKFGPGDYTALQDAREVVWNQNKISPIDGKPGAYQAINGGRRWENGTWTSEFKIPPPPD